ncbi:hypothetical protein HDU85_005375 [Gaertneriomyces sp. JEL0708]|nr:hypothetical protein HDU85_005375 [Gaertneriomyces sp. JEL0708]
MSTQSDDDGQLEDEVVVVVDSGSDSGDHWEYTEEGDEELEHRFAVTQEWNTENDYMDDDDDDDDGEDDLIQEHLDATEEDDPITVPSDTIEETSSHHDASNDTIYSQDSPEMDELQILPSQVIPAPDDARLDDSEKENIVHGDSPGYSPANEVTDHMELDIAPPASHDQSVETGLPVTLGLGHQNSPANALALSEALKPPSDELHNDDHSMGVTSADDVEPAAQSTDDIEHLHPEDAPALHIHEETELPKPESPGLQATIESFSRSPLVELLEYVPEVGVDRHTEQEAKFDSDAMKYDTIVPGEGGAILSEEFTPPETAEPPISSLMPTDAQLFSTLEFTLRVLKLDPSGVMTPIMNLARSDDQVATFIMKLRDVVSSSLPGARAPDTRDSENGLSVARKERRAHWEKAMERGALKQVAAYKAKLETCTTQLDERDKLCEHLKAELARKEEQVRNVQLASHGLNPLVQALETEKRDLATLLSKKQQDVQRLVDDCEQMQTQVITLRAELRSSSNRITELETQALKDKLQISGKEQEVLQQQSMVQWLKAEFDRRSEELQQVRLEKTRRVSDLQSDHEAVVQDKIALEFRLQTSQQRVEELQEKVQELMTKIDEQNATAIRRQEQFKREMDAQRRTAELHERDYLSAQRTLEEMQMTGTEEREEWERDRQALLEKLHQVEDEAKHWKEQIDNAHQLYENDTAQSIKDRTPSHEVDTGDTSSNVSSRITLNGMTYTQLYASYHDESQKRIRLERENQILEEKYMDMLREVQSYEPYCQELQAENDNLRVRYHSQTSECEKLSEAVEQLQAEKAAADSEAKKLSSANIALQREIRDAARQIRALFYHLHRVRPDMSGDIDEYVRQLVERSSSVTNGENPEEAEISAQFVEIDSLEQLVDQHIKLRSFARQLAQQLHQKQLAQSDSLNSEVAQAQHRIVELEENSAKLARQLQSALKQRNDLKKQLDGAGGYRSLNHSVRSEQSENSIPADRPLLDVRIEEEIMDLERQYTSRVLELEAKLSTLADENRELHVTTGKLQNHIQRKEESYQLLSTTQCSLREEKVQLQTRLTELMDSSSKKEGKIQELSDQLMREKLHGEQLKHTITQKDIQLQVADQSRLRAEKERESFLNERNLASERAMFLQRQLEEKEESWRSEKRRLEEKLDNTDRELNLARKQLQEVRDNAQLVASTKDVELREADNKILELTTNHERIKGALSVARTNEKNYSERVADLTGRLELVEKKLEIYETRYDERDAEATPEQRLAAAKRELVAIQRELEQRTEDLTTATLRIDHFKQLAEDNEQRLIEANGVYETMVKSKDAEIAELQERIAALEVDRDSVMERMRATDLEMLQAREKSELQLREAQQKLQAIELQLESSRKAEEVALQTQEALRVDVQRFNQIAEDARDNYQRQVVELSDAIQARQKLESECNQLKEEIRAARDEAVIAKAKLNSAEETWDKVKLSLEEQITRAEHRVEDLSQQNRMLYAQLDRMHVSQQPAEENLSDGVEDSNKRSIQDLTGLNQALRGERDSLRDKLAISTTDNERLRLQLSVVERDLDECRARLEEHSRSQTTGLEGRHQELIEKVEQANLFRESNITLRAQLEQSAKRNGELESKLSELKKELDPLRQQVSDLVLEVDAQKAGNTKLAEDNKYWKARVDQVLQKYQRVDPHEYEALKEQVVTLAAEKSSLESSNNSLLTEVSSLGAKYSELEESLRTQIKAQEGKFSKALEVVQKQKAIIQNKAKEAAEKDQVLASKDQQVASLTEQVKKLHEQLGDLGNHEFVVGLRAEYEKKHRETVTKANATLARFKEEQKNLRNEVRNLKQENEALQARITTFGQTPDMQATTDVSHLQHRITELEAHTEARVKEALDAFKMKASAETTQQTTSLKSLRDELAREKQKTFQLDVQLRRLQSQRIGTYQSSAPTAASPEISRGEQGQVSFQPLSEITISPAKRAREDDDEGGKGGLDTAVAKGAEILEAEHKDKKLKVGVPNIEHAPLKPTSPREPEEHAPLMPVSPQQPQEHAPLMQTDPLPSLEQSLSVLHADGNVAVGQSAAVEMEREESLEEGQVSEAPDGDNGRTPMEGIVETGTPMPPSAEDRAVESQQHTARTSETEQAYATSMEKPGSQVNAASEDQPENLPMSPRIREETGAASAKHDTPPNDPAASVVTQEKVEELLPEVPAPTLELASAPLLSLPAPAIVTTREENPPAESVVPQAEAERPPQLLPSEIITTAPVPCVVTPTAPVTLVPSITATVPVPTTIVAAAPITAVEPANAESRAAFLRQQLLNRMKGGQSPAPQPQTASIQSKLSAQAISQPEPATVSAPQALSVPLTGSTTLPGLQIPSAQKADIARVAVTQPPSVSNPEESTAPVSNPNPAPEMPATSGIQPSVTANSEPGSQTPPAAPVSQASHMTRSATARLGSAGNAGGGVAPISPIQAPLDATPQNAKAASSDESGDGTLQSPTPAARGRGRGRGRRAGRARTPSRGRGAQH